MKQDARNTKDAFTCKHLLPCGMCEKTDKLCTQTEPKRHFVSVTFICKKCGERNTIQFDPTQPHLDGIERYLSRHKHEKCGGDLVELERCLVSENEKSTAIGNPGRNVPKARLHRCEDCAKYDACRSFHFLPSEPFVDDNGRCKLFVKKPPKMKDLMNERVWKPMCDYVARLRKRFENKREAEVLKELAKAKREEEKAIWSHIHKTMQKKGGDKE